MLAIQSIEQKKYQLTNMLYSVLHAPAHQEEFRYLLNQLGLSEKDILEEFLHYNLDLDAPEGNAVYESLANRVVLHAHNLVRGSWHIERQQAVVDFLRMIQASSVVDVGFGVPSQYVRELVLNEGHFQLTFCDYYNAAFVFAKKLLSIWHSAWERCISFRSHDMNSLDYLGDFDAYLMLDSVEHADQPELYLKKQVDLSPERSYFMLSLPVGPLIARHHIAWETDAEAAMWLRQCGLVVRQSRAIYVNLQVDLFADALGGGYHDVLFLCQKINGKS